MATTFPTVIVMMANNVRMSAHGIFVDEKLSIPFIADPSASAWLKNRIIIAKTPAFGATERYAVIVVGEPSYTSGVQKWNGTAETL